VTVDTVVVGAGLAGLCAALRLADEGQRVLVVARGVGATHLAPATVDVLGYAPARVESPAHALAELVSARPGHPYARLGPEVVSASLAWLRERVPELGFSGSLADNVLLPTAVGVAKPSALAPAAMTGGDLRAGGRFVFVGLRGLKDFYPAYLAANLARAELPAAVEARAVELSPPADRRADVGGPGFARRFENASFRESVARELAPQLEPGERVGFPAVLGLTDADVVRRELEQRLERPVFEVATLPPSVPGIRLHAALTAQLRRCAARLIVGDSVVGAETDGRRVESVVAQTAARRVAYRARSFVLATGGLASGGIELDSRRGVREPILGLPVASAASEGPLYRPGYFDDHPLAAAGLSVDERLRPVNRSGVAAFENLHAAGALLGGAVPWREHSGTGISVATGYAAAAAILEGAS
jgi:glycerol-3-phosphate dehydrogenase subunit B